MPSLQPAIDFTKRYQDSRRQKFVVPQVLRIWMDKAAASEFGVPRWMEFCKAMHDAGFDVRLDRAKSTVSKYIYVVNPRAERAVKVRYSNHRPSRTLQRIQGSDFYVGVHNRGCVTTEQVIELVKEALS